MDDALQLGGFVELHVRGEAETVAQRRRQQARARGGADQRERGQLQRDGGGAGALADDDVDAEVLHRHVEHLLGGPRHAVDLVEEEDLALLE